MNNFKIKIAFSIFVFLFAFSIAFCQVKNEQGDGRKILIPVVVHILYTKDAENISDSMITKEINDLNLDFSAQNDLSVLDSSFKDMVAKSNIEFYLLDTVLQGSGIKGVQRIAKSRRLATNDFLINPTLCLNIFTVNQGSASDILSDRVNLYFDDIGKHYHVLTHETGHWLGLYHIWGKIGNCSWLKLQFGDHDDEIDDTPTQWTCTDLHFSQICPPHDKELYYDNHKIMYNNFMDYSGCRCLFTPKQVIKMRNNIINTKSDLFYHLKNNISSFFF